jgi:hypothetical protein
MKLAPAQIQWQTSGTEITPVQPTQQKRATRTIRISSVKPATARKAPQKTGYAPNPLTSLRNSLPAN